MELSWKERGPLLEIFLEGELWRVVPKGSFLPVLPSLEKVESEEEFFSLFKALEEKLAFQKGVDLLHRQALSSALLRQKLERKGFSAEASKKAAERLVDLSLLCDESFGEAAIRRLSRKYGNMRLRLELQRKGVSPFAIVELLKTIPPEEERIGAHLPASMPQEKKEKMRLYRSLARLGFSSDLIFTAMNSRS